MSDESMKIAQVLHDSADALRKVAAERDALQEKCAAQSAQLEAQARRSYAEKVAAQMTNKNLHNDVPFGQLVQELEKAASEGRLTTIEAAVDLVAPNMGLKTAALADAPNTGTGSSELERFLLS